MPHDPDGTVTEAARLVLETGSAQAKAQAAQSLFRSWSEGAIVQPGEAGAPDEPARPERPFLCPPRDMPKRRRARSAAGRIALLHALAHIELNAIDLAFDVIARFAAPVLPRAFYDDWIRIGNEESRHFLMLRDRLLALGADYGDLPAHAGLWEAAQATGDDLLARLAIVPMVLEARGLDVTPPMIHNMVQAGDHETAEILRTILSDEIRHVAAGRHWFQWEARRRGLDPIPTWQALVQARFRGALKPPFNEQARKEAGFPAAYWDPAGAAAG